MKRKAVSVEALLTWAYREERVDQAVMTGGKGGGCATGMVAAVGARGTTVESSGVSWVGELDAPPDARAVHRLVQGLAAMESELPLARLVMDAARLGKRPGPMAFEGPRLVPFPRDQGLDTKGYDPKWKCGKEAAWSRLKLVPSAEGVVAHRALYGAWRRGVELVWRQLLIRPGLLVGHQVTDELPPELPAPAHWWQVPPLTVRHVSKREAEAAWKVRWNDRQERRREREMKKQAEGEREGLTKTAGGLTKGPNARTAP